LTLVRLISERFCHRPPCAFGQRRQDHQAVGRGHGGALIRTFEGHSGEVQSVALSPDGSRMLSGSDDGTAWIWKLATGEHIVSRL
jgi:WD40 repeat protein